MKGFSGFPPKGKLVKLPVLFFSDLLPQIDHLGELKVTLFCFWRLQQKEGHSVYLRKQEMLADRVWLSGLAVREEDRIAALDEGLERAVARGTLLHVHAEGEDRTDDFYFVNTDKGRKAIEGIENGTWYPSDEEAVLEFAIERPSIFTLYEQNIGPLTPLISEHLDDLERDYSRQWLEEAIQAAVMNNVRKLNYVTGILKRWRDQGKPKAAASPQSSDWYISGKYGDEIEY